MKLTRYPQEVKKQLQVGKIYTEIIQCPKALLWTRQRKPSLYDKEGITLEKN